MTITVSYHLPDGVALDPSRTFECFADVSISNIRMESLANVLAELSRLSVNDFARLATLSSFKPDHDAEDKDVESFMRALASPHSGLEG